jgi:hypothetical protein
MTGQAFRPTCLTFIRDKGKGTIFPIHAMRVCKGNEVKINQFLTLALVSR